MNPLTALKRLAQAIADLVLAPIYAQLEQIDHDLEQLAEDVDDQGAVLREIYTGKPAPLHGGSR